MDDAAATLPPLGMPTGYAVAETRYPNDDFEREELVTKISELFAAGTKLVWVIRLVGPRRVEVHEPGRKMRTVLPGEELAAPGVLRNPVPVEALYDRQAAHDVTLRNLLQRQGYQDLDEVRTEGREEGREEGVLAGLRRSIVRLWEQGLGPMPEEIHRKLEAIADVDRLDNVLAQVSRAELADDVDF